MEGRGKKKAPTFAGGSSIPPSPPPSLPPPLPSSPYPRPNPGLLVSCACRAAGLAFHRIRDAMTQVVEMRFRHLVAGLGQGGPDLRVQLAQLGADHGIQVRQLGIELRRTPPAASTTTAATPRRRAGRRTRVQLLVQVLDVRALQRT